MSKSRLLIAGAFFLGLVMATIAVGSLLDNNYPPRMRVIPVADYIDPRQIRLPSPGMAEPSIAECNRQARLYGLSRQRLAEVGGSLGSLSMGAAVDSVLLDIWFGKSLPEKLRTAMFGPKASDFAEARRSAAQYRDWVVESRRIGDFLTVCVVFSDESEER